MSYHEIRNTTWEVNTVWQLNWASLKNVAWKLVPGPFLFLKNTL